MTYGIMLIVLGRCRFWGFGNVFRMFISLWFSAILIQNEEVMMER